MHVRIAHVVAGVAAGAAATLGLVGTAGPAVAVATPNVHVLHTRQ